MPFLTPLSTILNQMKRLQVLSNVTDNDLIRDLDEGLKNVLRVTQLPWTLQKQKLRVFDDVLEYPVAADHDELAYVDNNGGSYGSRARFHYKTLQEFYEDGDNRNDLGEIWNNGTRFLGVRYNTGMNGASQLISQSEDVSLVTLSGVASSAVLDNVIFDDGNGSVRFSVLSTGTASYTDTFTAFGDSNYLRKYYFKKIFLPTNPTSITLRFGSSTANYFYSTVTTQFSGQPFQANAWNLVAMDLSTATQFGTVNTNAFAVEGFDINGAAVGTYYSDSSYLRGWILLDYWYYSCYHVATEGSTVADQRYFYNDTTDVPADGSSLVGDSEFADLVRYAGQRISLADKEDKKLFDKNEGDYGRALAALTDSFPSMKPSPISRRWRFSWQEGSSVGTNHRD